MDPTNFYQLGQILHQERLQAAEAYYLSKTLNREPTLWERLRNRLDARAVSPAMSGQISHCDAVATSR